MLDLVLFLPRFIKKVRYSNFLALLLRLITYWKRIERNWRVRVCLRVCVECRCQYSSLTIRMGKGIFCSVCHGV